MDERSKVKWPPQMLIDLLRCKETQDEMKRKKQQRGLRNVMFRTWSETGCDRLNLSAQNVHNGAAKAERSSNAPFTHTRILMRLNTIL